MLKQINYFQAVVRNKSFTEAAKECLISQSAISQQIQALERELGVKLLDRKYRKVHLTPAGEYFYSKSSIMLDDLHRIIKQTKRISDSEDQVLRIGYSKSYSSRNFSATIHEFSKLFPDVQIELYSANHDKLFEMLRYNQVDLIFTDDRKGRPEDFRTLSLEACYTIVEMAQKSEDDLGSERIDLDDLRNTPCILVADHDQRESESEYFRETIGIQSDLLFVPTLDQARMMVLAGRGYLPVECTCSALEVPDGIVRKRLRRQGQPIVRHYCLLWKADNPNHFVDEFSALLKNSYQELSPYHDAFFSVEEASDTAASMGHSAH